MKPFIFSSAILCTIIFMESCNFNKKHQEVDSFYTNKNLGDIYLMPLSKPLKLNYDRTAKKWYLQTPLYFKQNMAIDSIFEIGVEKTYVYGKIFKKKNYIENYTPKDYVFVDKYNVTSWSQRPEKLTEDEIQIYPTDKVNKLFILPERWFVINTADSTTEAFFSISAYKKYLKQKGILGKMYNIESDNKKFQETGILPWFPDSVKTKLKN